jgi:hypothetical protein
MELDGLALDRAYAVFEEWGPKRRIPRKARLAETFPELSEPEIESTLETLGQVTETVWAIAKLGGEPKLGRDKVTALLQDRHPFLEAEGLRRALFLTNYYAWHEGYAQR